MNATEKDLENLKEAYRLWSVTNGEYYEPWLRLIADNFVNGTMENGAPGLDFTKERRGREAMVEYFDLIRRDWDMLCHVADEFLMDRDRIVALIRATWRSKLTGKVVDSPAAHLWQFKNGKAVKKFEFVDSAAWKEAIITEQYRYHRADKQQERQAIAPFPRE